MTRNLRRLDRAGATELGTELVARVSKSFAMRCLRRFQGIQGRDRTLVLAGQAFTTLVPLLILLSALSSSDDLVASRIITRFHLEGEAADAVRTLFARPPDAAGAMTVVGVALLLVSLLSFTKAWQRTYEAAWELPPAGLRGTLAGLSGVALLVAQVIVLAIITGVVRGAPAGGLLSVVIRVLVASVLWWELQYLLLSRRIGRRMLIPGAVVAACGQVVVSIYSATWMPRLVATDAERYGVIGVTFALLTWLILVSAGVVVSAVVSAEIGLSGGPVRRRQQEVHEVEEPGGATDRRRGRLLAAVVVVAGSTATRAQGPRRR